MMLVDMLNELCIVGFDIVGGNLGDGMRRFESLVFL